MKKGKNILLNLIILLLLTCTACDRSTRHVTEHLSQAEELIWTAPDSALHILESISTSNRLTGKEQADYVLLLSLAQYRCYIPVSSDSLINLAIEYYQDKNDADKKGAAFYVKGCILEEYCKDIPNALLAYKEAEMCIPDMNDKHYVAHIYSSLGYIYEKSLSFELAKEYYQKALQENTNIKDTTSQASDLLNLLGLYHIANDTDSINQCITGLLKCSDNLKDSILQSKIYHNIAVSKMHQEKYEEAETFFLSALHISPASLPYKTLAGLAQLYMKKGQKERADSLFQNALLSKDLPLRAYIYNQLYDEAWKTENFKKIAQYARLYIDTSDSIYNSHLYQEVLKVQRKYDHMQLLYQKSRQANIIYSFVIIISMVSGILCFLFIQYKKKRKEENEKLRAEIVQLVEILNNMKISYDENQNRLQDQINALRSKQEQNVLMSPEEYAAIQNTIDKLTKEKEQNEKEQHQEYEKLQAQFEALNQKLKEVEKQNNRFRLIYGNHDCVELKDIKALQVALNLSQNKSFNISNDREDIKHWLNLSKNGFADKLHKTYPMLDKTFLDICYLAALGLSIDEIAQYAGNIKRRSVERYMSLICQEVQYPISGKKGFESFINHILTI